MYSTSKRFEIRTLWDVIGKKVNSFSQLLLKKSPYKSFKLGDLRIPKEPGNKKMQRHIWGDKDAHEF